MIIEKSATDKRNSYKPIYFLESARKGERIILDELVENGGYQLLLPAYIGFSAKEGSGIYDPVLASGIEYAFYGMNKDISIDIEDLNSKLELYCAHALYTDLIDHKCGEYGDFVLYSIHKMLPYEKGGVLKVNNEHYEYSDRCSAYLKPEYSNIINYDLYAISQIRKRNARLWEKLLSESDCSRIEILRQGCNNVTPQTFPVLIHDYDRTKLYFELNESWFGAVSLYHTMIEPIAKEFKTSEWISQNIMNLPVHQDVTEENIRKMHKRMIELLSQG